MVFNIIYEMIIHKPPSKFCNNYVLLPGKHNTYAVLVAGSDANWTYIFEKDIKKLRQVFTHHRLMGIR